MIRRPDLRNESPWIKVDKQTYQILQIGSWAEINESEVDGHTMTLSIYDLICEDRYDKKLIDGVENS
jgi:hypothetical protein